MPRAIILLMDSFGIGSSWDASHYGDQGANTLGHILEYCRTSPVNTKRTRSGALHIPHLTHRGLLEAEQLSSNHATPTLKNVAGLNGNFGYCVEMSHGKDTPSGHWEITGVPVLFDWGYFPSAYPSFPPELIEEFIRLTQIPGILGNRHASGTQIIEELGVEHLETDKPIVYTSGDSVFQIAAHEASFGLERLYHICKIARVLVNPLNIGRVIARPFLGTQDNFYRTGNRTDYAMPPPEATVLEKLAKAQGTVIAIGKTADIFAHQGVTQEIKVSGNMAIFDATLSSLSTAPDRSLIFSNFVDFDSSYGHRRDVEGYAAALEEFDQRLPELDALLREDDLVFITADHGCDPTWTGTDHTREHIPLLVYSRNTKEGIMLGRRASFADIGQTLAEFFKLPSFKYGTSFLDKLSI